MIDKALFAGGSDSNNIGPQGSPRLHELHRLRWTRGNSSVNYRDGDDSFDDVAVDDDDDNDDEQLSGRRRCSSGCDCSGSAAASGIHTKRAVHRELEEWREPSTGL